MVFIKNKGFLLFDLIVWLIIAPGLIILILSFLYPVARSSVSLQKDVVQYKEVLLINQAIAKDLMRGGDIDTSDKLIINGAEYYKKGSKLIRSYNGKEYRIGRGDIEGKVKGDKLKVQYKDTTLTYDIFWSEYNE